LSFFIENTLNTSLIQFYDLQNESSRLLPEICYLVEELPVAFMILKAIQKNCRFENANLCNI